MVFFNLHETNTKKKLISWKSILNVFSKQLPKYGFYNC